MAKRLKSKTNLIEIPDFKHADRTLLKLGEIQMQIESIKAAAADDVNEIKLRAADKIEPLQTKTKVYLESLEAFAVANKDSFGKSRSKKLYFGKLGWRKSTSISITKKTLELIKEIYRGAKLSSLVRVKQTPDKDALAKLTDDELAGVKAKRKVTDDFFAEPALPENMDYAQ